MSDRTDVGLVVVITEGMAARDALAVIKYVFIEPVANFGAGNGTGNAPEQSCDQRSRHSSERCCDGACANAEPHPDPGAGGGGAGHSADGAGHSACSGCNVTTHMTFNDLVRPAFGTLMIHRLFS
ncbi:hypothetical protein [Marinobacterium zhoushanense]|uniref:hypothetical protein n=1 Tax=Marinobacterium zhoushanense TaxID=1679163 RepID=UPI00166A0DA0|nr:hypothetical protein [Marinobacterium zhoushanense]